MPLVAVEIKNLEEVREFYSTRKLSNSIASGIALSSLELHKTLAKSVSDHYTARNNLNKQLLKRISTSKRGKSIIESGLLYKIQYSDLSKFPTTSFLGNINPGARRKGRVHVTTIARGQKKIIHGKSHRGGFIPADKNGKRTRLHKGGTQMLERVSSRRFPLRVLYGPSTVQMINWALKNTPSVDKVLDNLSEHILNNYK